MREFEDTHIVKSKATIEEIEEVLNSLENTTEYDYTEQLQIHTIVENITEKIVEASEHILKATNTLLDINLSDITTLHHDDEVVEAFDKLEEMRGLLDNDIQHLLSIKGKLDARYLQVIGNASSMDELLTNLDD